MRDLPSTLEILSSQQADDPHEMQIDMVTRGEQDRLAAVLGWALRDFVQMRWTKDRVAADAAATVVAPESMDLPLGDIYAGQDFPLVAEWTQEGLRGKALWRWVLYREAPAHPPTENVVLWVRADQSLVAP